MTRLRELRRVRQAACAGVSGGRRVRQRRVRSSLRRVGIGAPDPTLTGSGGMVAITELTDRLRVIDAVDAAVGPIKTRNRGFGAGQLLVGMSAAQLAGEDFLVGLDRARADAAGQQIAPVAGLASTTAAGLCRRLPAGRWQAIETGLATVAGRAWGMLPAPRRRALADGPVTVDLDASDVEVYGRKKRGVAYNHQGQRVGRPHVACWAETETVLAAELGSGSDDVRAGACGLLRRALASLPTSVRNSGRVATRADAGYFAGDLARTAHGQGIGFAIGAKRIAPLWRLLDGIAEPDWRQAVDMRNAQVAVANYRPADWPPQTMLLVRRVRLSAEQISADLRSRRRRTLHPEQRTLPLAELQALDTVYGYSFILTNLDVSSPDKAAAVEHWYRHRTTIENLFRDTKHGAALRHLPSGYPEVNTVWMWAALTGATLSGWLHHLTATTRGEDIISGYGTRGGKAMIVTWRHQLINIPARLVHHAGTLTLRPSPAHRDLLAEILARLRALPAPA